MAYPLIAWIHSPIGYETYLRVKETYPGEIICVLTRGLQFIEDCDLHAKGGLFYNDSEEEVDRIAKTLVAIVKRVRSRNQSFVALVPQIAIPYVRLLIESEFCAGFTFYDEGTLCHSRESMKKRSRNIYHSYLIKKSNAILELAECLGLDLDEFASKQISGVPLVNFSHEKLLGCISFFEKSFPGLTKTLLTPKEFPKDLFEALSSVRVILLVPRNRWPRIDTANFFRSIKHLLAFGQKDIKTVVRKHPYDGWEHWPDLLQEHVTTYEEFSNEFPDIMNREVAFLPFGSYVVPPQSTRLFLVNMGKTNFITLEG
ncbi:hypothetical protein OAQ35_01785 [Litorivicinus sp.]|nr:hypothetical protein [Litorivicinus sp.]